MSASTEIMPKSGPEYSQLVGLIFVFNLIVGTGALTMPSAFGHAGWMLSLIVVVLLAFTSYVTVTFIIESMAAANAVLKYKAVERMRKPSVYKCINEENRPLLIPTGCNIQASGSSVCSEDLYLNEYFDISNKVELGEMASLFFNKIGVNLFYICTIVYLFGDLAIYAAAVPKSMRDIACTYKGPENNSCNHTLEDSEVCWASTPSLTRMDVYRIFVAAFCLLLGPFTFFNVQKTKYLQIFTTVMRWLAFGLMVILASIRLAKGEGRGHPVAADFGGVPTLFGVCVYSFMCHHSLPSLVTPIKDKSRIYSLFLFDYCLILGFYALISFTGIFTFKDLEDLYTLNFQPDHCGGKSGNLITNIVPFQYFLGLFPVFTLSTNFPIISITLRNNLKALFHSDNRRQPWVVDTLVFPVVALLPAVGVAFATADLDILVGVTGSYAGFGIQYIIPAFLVFCSRKATFALFGNNRNQHTSPFRHRAWIWLTLVWATACITLVTVNHIVTRR